MAMADLSRRAAVAVVALLVVLPVIYRGGWLMGALAAALAMLGTREFCLLARRTGVRPFTRMAMAITAALVLAATAEPFFTGFAPLALTVVMGATVVLFVAAVRARNVTDKPLASVCSTLTAPLYVGGGLCFAVLLRHLPDTGVAVRAPGPLEGPLLLLFPLAVTWAGDIVAYFAGSLWGRRRLFPTVSPGKTLEGTVAGILAAGAAGLFFAMAAAEPFVLLGVGPGWLVGIALLIGAGGLAGDLAVSLLKREAGVKDTGSMLPGHGGVLDRLDAVLVTLPLAYAALRFAGSVSP